MKRLAEGAVAIRLGSLDRCRIGHAPVRGHRLPRPHRAHLAGGVVADRDDEVERGRAGRGEFVPGLAAQALGADFQPLQQLDRERVHAPVGMAAGAVSMEPALPAMVERSPRQGCCAPSCRCTGTARCRHEGGRSRHTGSRLKRGNWGATEAAHFGCCRATDNGSQNRGAETFPNSGTRHFNSCRREYRQRYLPAAGRTSPARRLPGPHGTART